MCRETLGVKVGRRVEAAATTFVLVLVQAFLLWAGTSCVDLQRLLIIGGLKAKIAGELEALFIYALPLLIVAGDGALFGGTYGMRNRELGLERMDGNPCGRVAGGVRIVAGWILLVVFPVDCVLLAIDPRRWTVADRLCRVVVVARW